LNPVVSCFVADLFLRAIAPLYFFSSSLRSASFIVLSFSAARHKEYLASQDGGTGATLDYVVRPDIAVKPEYEDPVEGYDTVDQEMTTRAPHTGRAFVDDRRKVWDIMSNICVKHYCFFYIKPDLRTRNRRDAYMLLFDNFLGPNNVEKKRFTW
jgi:hypothetical protein